MSLWDRSPFGTPYIYVGGARGADDQSPRLPS